MRGLLRKFPTGYIFTPVGETPQSVVTIREKASSTFGAFNPYTYIRLKANPKSLDPSYKLINSYEYESSSGYDFADMSTTAWSKIYTYAFSYYILVSKTTWVYNASADEFEAWVSDYGIDSRDDPSILDLLDYPKKAFLALEGRLSEPQIQDYIAPTELYITYPNLSRVRSEEVERLLPPKPDLYEQFTAAAKNAVALETNNIANVLSAIDVAKTLMNPSSVIKNAPKSIIGASKDSWLKYRYLYSTTKSDLEELQRNLYNIVHPDKLFEVQAESQSDGWSCYIHATMHYMQRSYNIWTNLKNAGFAPDLYNLWDLVPYSFVVDWFLGIGDYLEQFGDTYLYNPQVFQYENVVRADRFTGQLSMYGYDVDVTYYHRYLSQAPEFHFAIHKANLKTWGKRIIDAICLRR